MHAVMEILQAQRKRCLAGIMGSAEQSRWWNGLSREEQQSFRQKIIDSLNVFYDLARDIVTVTEESESTVRNEQAISMLLAKADQLQKTLDRVAEDLMGED